MEKPSENNLTDYQIIEFLSFSKKINENEIKKFLEKKEISFNNVEFIEFDDNFSKIKII